MSDAKARILQMRQQGLPNNQIVQQLQQQGLKSHEIFDAMNQVDTIPAGPIPQNEYSDSATQEDYPNQASSLLPPIQSPTQPLDDMTERIEEIAESIIEEKWKELIDNVNKIVDWKEKTETRIIKMESNFENIKNNFDKLHTGILGKISEYEHGMTDLGTEIKALEKVFQKILPTLTENVNELSRITKKLKN